MYIAYYHVSKYYTVKRSSITEHIPNIKNKQKDIAKKAAQVPVCSQNCGIPN